MCGLVPPESLSNCSGRAGAESCCHGDPEHLRALLDHVVDAFTDDMEDYLGWLDYDEYRPGFAAGAWKITPDRLVAALPRLIAEAEHAVEAERYPTLEAWLEAERAGELGRSPREPLACHLLDGSAAFDRFIEQRDRLARTWPRLCTGCGEEFRPDRSNIRRCPACRRRKVEEFPKG